MLVLVSHKMLPLDTGDSSCIVWSHVNIVLTFFTDLRYLTQLVLHTCKSKIS